MYLETQQYLYTGHCLQWRIGDTEIEEPSHRGCTPAQLYAGAKP